MTLWFALFLKPGWGLVHRPWSARFGRFVASTKRHQSGRSGIHGGSGFTSAALSICRSAMRTNRGTARCAVRLLGCSLLLGFGGPLARLPPRIKLPMRLSVGRSASANVNQSQNHFMLFTAEGSGAGAARQHRSDHSPWSSARLTHKRH
jgi:hypothetical protein